MESIMDKFYKNRETKEDIICIYMLNAENGVPRMMVETNENMYTEKLTEGFLVHQCNEFLRSLDLNIDIKFESYWQYKCLLDDITDLLNNEKHSDNTEIIEQDQYQKYGRDLNSLCNLIKQVLTNDKMAKQSDDNLYYIICKIILEKNGYDIEQFLFSQIILSTSKYGLPKYATVSRIRRKLQEKYPELKCSEKVAILRSINQDEFEEFAREE